MAGKKLWERLSPGPRKWLRAAVWAVAGILVVVLALLLLRAASALQDIFRAGLRDVYWN